MGGGVRIHKGKCVFIYFLYKHSVENQKFPNARVYKFLSFTNLNPESTDCCLRTALNGKQL